MKVDTALLPVRVAISEQWRHQVSADKVGSELTKAYITAVNRRCDTYSAPQHTGVVSTRHRLMVLLETRTWDEYQKVQNATLGLGSYRVSGPTEVNDEPVMTIVGNRLMISSFHVWTGWPGCAEPWMVETEVMACVQRIRELRPKLIAQSDYSRYSDEELSKLDDRHRATLIENRAL
ncbi:hypothetical protein ACFXO9_29785 [Nocardia tengchongensis]|uniref:hypothetical protein n=1 Tax=Nocardia tengchongensis TaxID=2055889 RepID=UPI0036CC32FC